MPRTCCVPGCSANYRSEKTATVTTFRFPKDPKLRDVWVKAINRENYTPHDNSVVCTRHFSDDLIVRIDTVTRDDGSVLSVPRTIPKLMAHAIPHIFPNQPSGFTKKKVQNCRSPTDQCEEQMPRDNNISVSQVADTEKRLKLSSLLKLHSHKCGEFELKSLELKCTESTDEIIDSEFMEAVLKSSNVVHTTEENSMVLVFISGYVAKSINKLVNCEKCMRYLVRNRTLEVDCPAKKMHSYLVEIDRGGLKWPTDFLITLSVIVFKIFQTLISETFEEEFQVASNHQGVLQSLVLQKLTKLCCNLLVQCSCGSTLYELSSKCVNIFSSIFINNYCKVKNDFSAKKHVPKQTKKRKRAVLFRK